MKYYIICSVRGVEPDPSITAYVEELEKRGHQVHYPPRDVDQNDLTGERICKEHLSAMKSADYVLVFWNVNSKGSHFDLGMAYALEKIIIGIRCEPPDTEGKSYWKAVVEAKV